MAENSACICRRSKRQRITAQGPHECPLSPKACSSGHRWGGVLQTTPESLKCLDRSIIGVRDANRKGAAAAALGLREQKKGPGRPSNISFSRGFAGVGVLPLGTKRAGAPTIPCYLVKKRPSSSKRIGPLGKSASVRRRISLYARCSGSGWGPPSPR